MDYTRFKFLAGVDWLELDVGTLNPHPAWRIHKASLGAFSYVTGLDRVTGLDIQIGGNQGKNTPTTRFAIRIQNPERFSTVFAALDTIRERLDPYASVMVRGIEIAFDAYRLPGTTDDELAEMVEVMLRGISRPESSNQAPRFYSWRGTPEFRQGKQAVRIAAQQGKTAMYGNAGDNFIVRGYLKNYDTIQGDNGKPLRKTLDNPLKHRARVEVRLQGEACPLKTLEDLECFKFEKLARFFKFREAEEYLSGVGLVVFDKIGSNGSVIDQTGQLIEAYAYRGRARKTAPNAKASPLNEIARDRLRKLAVRWCSKAGGGMATKAAKFDEDSGSLVIAESCTNDQQVSPANDRQHWAERHSSISQNATLECAVLNTSLLEPTHRHSLSPPTHVSEREATASKDKDYPEKQGLQSGEGKLYVQH